MLPTYSFDYYVQTFNLHIFAVDYLHNKHAVKLQSKIFKSSTLVTMGKVLNVTSQTNIITPLHTADFEAKICSFKAKSKLVKIMLLGF